jgi:hypothetical protein
MNQFITDPSYQILQNATMTAAAAGVTTQIFGFEISNFQFEIRTTGSASAVAAFQLPAKSTNMIKFA